MLNLQRVKLCTQNGGESNFSSVGSLSFRCENVGRLGSIGSILQPEDFLSDDREEVEETTGVPTQEAVGLEPDETQGPRLMEGLLIGRVEQDCAEYGV